MFVKEETKIKLLDSDGRYLGIVSFEKATEIAKERKLDLIEINNKSVPKLFKITNYEKYRYYLKKKRNKGRRTLTKEVRFRLNISKFDLETKIKNISRFISRGIIVKLTILLRRGELLRNNDGLNNFVAHLNDHLKNISNLSKTMFSGNNVVIKVTPKNDKNKKIN